MQCLTGKESPATGEERGAEQAFKGLLIMVKGLTWKSRYYVVRYVDVWTTLGAKVGVLHISAPEF